MKQKANLYKNFMRNRKSFIFLIILCLGAGFAFLSSQLTITGNTSVSGNKWSVYFNNVEITEGSVDATVEPTVSGTTTTSLEYTVLLDKPGDFYEFTVDAVNDGTIDAMIESITTPNIESRVLQYVNYSALYADGCEIAQNDVLEAKSTRTYKIRVEYKKNIDATDLDENDINLSLIFGVNYVQSTIKPAKEFRKLIKSSALSDSSINFLQASSDSNGNGLYVLSGTENNENPIYYYRGAVTNNNAKFAGFCWKIVRTTETGGTKLIYNGSPDSNGNCNNTISRIASTYYNSDTKYKSLAYAGYMYGTEYGRIGDTYNSSYIYGKSFTYNSGTYTLTNTQSGIDDNHHYSCLNSTGTCSELYYIYNYDSSKNTNAFYITLTGGKSVEDAIAEMKVNTKSSNIKATIDNWFNTSINSYFTNLDKNYSDYLEDTVWCNDRSYREDGTSNSFEKSGWNPNGGSIINSFEYAASKRMEAGTPRVDCPNKNDAFTVNDTVNGNGALTYPVGLLTADEIMLAGGANSSNTTYYLRSNQVWWTMTPSAYRVYNAGFTYEPAVHVYIVDTDGSMKEYRIDTDFYYYDKSVIPVLSVASNVKVAPDGDGSASSPYEFIIQ